MKNSDADPIFDPKALVSQNKDLTAKLNTLHDLNERFRSENAKVKQHYKELCDSIKITRAKTNDQKNSLLTKIENLKTQLKGKIPCVTIDVKTPKVSAFEKYAIDVEPIPPHQRSNRNVHHGYLNSLKDTLDTLRKIVEEARSELPSDTNLDHACVYTKRSQELLANASASCPKAVNKRDKFIATTPVTKKKRVTFANPLESSGNNTPKHVKQQSVQPTNVPILPSIGVNTATIASGSKPRSNTKKDKTLPAKSVPKKKVEDHPRNNKSKLSKTNRVDSYSNTPGKKVPKKVLRYFPIIPRLQRLYKSSHTAKEMTWHATGKCTEPGKMQHPVDGRAWKNFDTKYPNFAKEPRNVRLGLAADGFNPFGNLSQAYSMWPVILTTYNLPPWLCMKESSFMLTLLIPGPKSPGKDIDVYLRPLIDDLKVLWALKGVETIDVATGQKFNMRAMVLWTINDFPARSSLSGWSGQGYKACPTCNKDTPSVRVLGKTTYVGHRRFLKKPHK
ncbi:hypothetical protein Tco_0409204 [Tanacetum coccineum]